MSTNKIEVNLTAADRILLQAIMSNISAAGNEEAALLWVLRNQATTLLKLDEISKKLDTMSPKPDSSIKKDPPGSGPQALVRPMNGKNDDIWKGPGVGKDPSPQIEDPKPGRDIDPEFRPSHGNDWPDIDLGDILGNRK